VWGGRVSSGAPYLVALNFSWNQKRNPALVFFLRKGVVVFRPILFLGVAGACLLATVGPVGGQTLGLRGEASLSGILSDASADDRQLLARYVPELSFSIPLSQTLTLDGLFSSNLWAQRTSSADGPVETRESAEAYRAWVRASTHRFEVRAGLQKISFGSASLFRPLMWFDQMDPRDPLRLSEGVWGLLSRSYLPGNVTVWGWGLRGNGERKGWELIPTLEGAFEGGGRIQAPLGPGEVGATYHHRRFDLEKLGIFPPGTIEPRGGEDRFGLDGKWDLEVGVWLEAVFIRQDSPELDNRWIRGLSLGTDYTFEVGNGLTVLAEYMLKENPVFRSTQPLQPPTEAEADLPRDGAEFQGAGVEGRGRSQLQLTSFTANYPVGVLDRFGLAIYRDWEDSSWYRLLEWRRSYDRFRFHLLTFWNPEESAFFPSFGGDGTASSGSLTGKGVQVMLVYNH